MIEGDWGSGSITNGYGWAWEAHTASTACVVEQLEERLELRSGVGSPRTFRRMIESRVASEDCRTGALMWLPQGAPRIAVYDTHHTMVLNGWHVRDLFAACSYFQGSAKRLVFGPVRDQHLLASMSARMMGE
jgi:hypothetical protein